MIQLLEKFYHFVQDTPDKTAIVDNGGERATSYKELDEAVTAIRKGLSKEGFSGKHIALIGTPIEGLKMLWRCRYATQVYDYGIGHKKK